MASMGEVLATDFLISPKPSPVCRVGTWARAGVRTQRRTRDARTHTNSGIQLVRSTDVARHGASRAPPSLFAACVSAGPNLPERWATVPEYIHSRRTIGRFCLLTELSGPAGQLCELRSSHTQRAWRFSCVCFSRVRF